MKADVAETDRNTVAGTGAGRVTRRRVVAGGAALLGLSAVATAAYAAAIEPQGLVVTRYEPSLPSWPTGRKLSVTVIADLHAGGPDMMLPHVRRVIDTANGLKSDLMVLLGDYVARYRFKTERLPDGQLTSELERLEAPLGVWAILGNHDWWYDLKAVRRVLADARIPVMENDAVKLGGEDRQFWLAGIGDQLAHPLGRGHFRGVDDLPGTLAQVHTPDPVLLLVHEPDIFPRVPDRVALTLAGHTHGGQIRVPFIWPAFVPSKFGKRFAYGQVVEEGRHIIVSGGLGTSIIPARLGVPPEILRIELGT
jgi:predicted MPP superfamily phosphohydrolase